MTPLSHPTASSAVLDDAIDLNQSCGLTFFEQTTLSVLSGWNGLRDRPALITVTELPTADLRVLPVPYLLVGLTTLLWVSYSCGQTARSITQTYTTVNGPIDPVVLLKLALLDDRMRRAGSGFLCFTCHERSRCPSLRV